MFHHVKELQFDARVSEPDPRFAKLLLEQFGGATGELTAGLQYFVQSFHTDDAGIRDMLQDIATEEFGHLEMVGMLIEQHTARADQSKLQDVGIFALRGHGPHFLDAQGSAWKADYVMEGGSPVRDLRANIAAEAGALQTYENLLKMAPDEGTRKALVHLATREVAHAHMFMKALESMGKLSDPLFGDLKPDDTVNVYYNMSSDGQANLRGPWNTEPTFQYVPNPQAELLGSASKSQG